MGIFVTTMNTLDKKKIIIPNGVITGNVIHNVNGNGTRRVDMIAGIGYGDDMSKPAPNVAVSELGDSSVNFVVRPWVQGEDYRTVWFDARGVSIPFPKRDVHFYQESPDKSPDARADGLGLESSTERRARA